MFTWLYINVCSLNETSPNETSSLSSILGFLPFYYYFNDSVHFPIKFGTVLEFEHMHTLIHSFFKPSPHPMHHIIFTLIGSGLYMTLYAIWKYPIKLGHSLLHMILISNFHKYRDYDIPLVQSIEVEVHSPCLAK